MELDERSTGCASTLFHVVTFTEKERKTFNDLSLYSNTFFFTQTFDRSETKTKRKGKTFVEVSANADELVEPAFDAATLNIL